MTHQSLVLSTWRFGLTANAAALACGGNALDAVEAGCCAVEADPSVDSVGVGGIPDASGRVSLDGCVMLSPARCGAVCCVREHLHVVSIARRVMEQTPHIMLAGDAADAFAREQGFESANLLTDKARQTYEQRRENTAHDTIGVLAIDSDGRLAGACSTSGTAMKLPGRVGDSPIIGQGLYVDPGVGAAVATGAGELITGLCATFLAVELMRGGATPLDALKEVLARAVSAYDLADDDQIGLIALRPDGQWAGAALREDFVVAANRELVKPRHVAIHA